MRRRSGAYYARLFLRGKELWKSLEPASFSVAEAALQPVEKELRSLGSKGIYAANTETTRCFCR